MIQCSDLSGRESTLVVESSFWRGIQRPKVPELGPITVLRRIAGVRGARRNTTLSEQDLKQESSPDFVHSSLLFGCRQDECQTLFLISKYRSGLQHPGAMQGEKNYARPLAPTLSLPYPRCTRTDYETERVWNLTRSGSTDCIIFFLVLVTFRQRRTESGNNPLFRLAGLVYLRTACFDGCGSL